MHEVLVNRLGGLSLPRKSVVRLTDRPDMTLDVYCGRKTTKQQLKRIIRAINVLKENSLIFQYNNGSKRCIYKMANSVNFNYWCFYCRLYAADCGI